MTAGRKHHQQVSPVTIEARAADVEALKLKQQGLTYRQIAAEQNCDVSTAHARVRRSYRALTSQRDQEAQIARDLDLDLIESLIAAAMPQAFGEAVTVTNEDGTETTHYRPADMYAIRTITRLLERRAGIYGYDAPKRTELSGPGGGPIELDDARARVAQALGVEPEQVVQVLAARRRAALGRPEAPPA